MTCGTRWWTSPSISKPGKDLLRPTTWLMTPTLSTFCTPTISLISSSTTTRTFRNTFSLKIQPAPWLRANRKLFITIPTTAWTTWRDWLSGLLPLGAVPRTLRIANKLPWLVPLRITSHLSSARLWRALSSLASAATVP
jgi:hypothetical protein